MLKQPKAAPPRRPALVPRERAQRTGEHVPLYQTRVFWVLAAIGGLAVLLVLYTLIAPPSHEYHIATPPDGDIASPEFARMLEALSDSKIRLRSKIEVLTNGENFYAAELQAIRQAQHSINLEAYIFYKGEVTRQFVEAMAERARSGVKVNVVLDGVGSFTTWRSFVRPLTDAGGKVVWYHPVRPKSLLRFNNRTHREILVVDGRVAVIGGAGYGDFWLKAEDDLPRWRDSKFRVEGDAVVGLQSAFVENWLEASGEVLTGERYFPFPNTDLRTPAMVINSSPSMGASTRARILFQTLLAGAKRRIYIQTPYFVPDRSARDELKRAIARGVDVRIIVPGRHNDHLMVRRASRRLYGELLQAGAHIYEYQPTMIHVKAMMVDDLWIVVGTTNFDNRSFGLNDEINLAAMDAGLAARLVEDFWRDVGQSHEITYQVWQDRPWYEKAQERLASVFERQQ